MKNWDDFWDEKIKKAKKDRKVAQDSLCLNPQDLSYFYSTSSLRVKHFDIEIVFVVVGCDFLLFDL